MEKFGFEQKEIQKEKSIATESARQHLDGVPDQYFEAINRYSEEEFQGFVKKLEPMRMFLKDPQSIASVGVGGGLELRVLHELFKDKNTKIIGIDLSRKALEVAREYLDKNNIEASLVQSGAVELPFKPNNTYINGMVLSAIIHEIYSYVHDGKFAWRKAIEEVSNTLSEDGVLLVRDFAAPKTNDLVELSFLNQETKDFYKYFRERFRTFKTWNDDEIKKIVYKRVTLDDYPLLLEDSVSVVLPFCMASELMLHYKNYVADLKNGAIVGFPDNWKEIDERYLIPDPESVALNVMDPEKYKDRILQCANDTLNTQGYKLECMLSETTNRLDTANELKKYFSIRHENLDQEELLRQATSKMELVFKKTKLTN